MTNKITSPYSHLNIRKIIDVFMGDTIIDRIQLKDGAEQLVAMPNMSGRDLANLSTQFGLPVTYEWGNALSRWKYFSNLLEHCTLKNTCSDLITYLFSKERFQNSFSNLPNENIETLYTDIIKRIIKEINDILFFSHHKLIKRNKKISVISLDSQLELKTPKIEEVSQEYIKDISDRAIKEIIEGNYDSAITMARTLLEEVLIYGIEIKGETHDNSGKINRLYKQVKDLYKMHIDRDTDIRIKKLLSGLESIISGIGEMRNKYSNAHGLGPHRINLKRYHATLLVNASLTMSEFILAVIQENLNNKI